MQPEPHPAPVIAPLPAIPEAPPRRPVHLLAAVDDLPGHLEEIVRRQAGLLAELALRGVERAIREYLPPSSSQFTYW